MIEPLMIVYKTILILQVYSFVLPIFLLGVIFKNDAGHNCPRFYPQDYIIKTENSCKAAAAYLGKHYSGNLSNTNYPAGCYWYLKAKDYELSFNQIIDPLQTYPKEFGKKGGVCTNKGKVSDY